MVVVRCGGVVECVGVGGGIRRGCFDGGDEQGPLGVGGHSKILAATLGNQSIALKLVDARDAHASAEAAAVRVPFALLHAPTR